MTKQNKREQAEKDLPAIPDKRYFTISEVGILCGVKAYVLRYWEQEFPQLSPAKRRGNRRYYQRKDVLMVREIKTLLYEKGYTIEGARQQLSGQEAKNIRKIQNSHALLQTTVSQLEKVADGLEEI